MTWFLQSSFSSVLKCFWSQQWLTHTTKWKHLSMENWCWRNLIDMFPTHSKLVLIMDGNCFYFLPSFSGVAEDLWNALYIISVRLRDAEIVLVKVNMSNRKQQNYMEMDQKGGVRRRRKHIPEDVSRRRKQAPGPRVPGTSLWYLTAGKNSIHVYGIERQGRAKVNDFFSLHLLLEMVCPVQLLSLRQIMNDFGSFKASKFFM